MRTKESSAIRRLHGTRPERGASDFDWIFDEPTVEERPQVGTDGAALDRGRFRDPFRDSSSEPEVRVVHRAVERDPQSHFFDAAVQQLRALHADSAGNLLTSPICLLVPVGPLELAGIRTFVIGGSAACDLVLDDPLISSRHARLVIFDAGVVLQRCGSATPLRVNGIELSRSVSLRAGDRILVGATELHVFPGESSPPLSKTRKRRKKRSH
jgi:pSer/pThr/pTyr-binding forkhead associated (FHA) protein